MAFFFANDGPKEARKRGRGAGESALIISAARTSPLGLAGRPRGSGDSRREVRAKHHYSGHLKSQLVDVCYSQFGEIKIARVADEWRTNIRSSAESATERAGVQEMRDRKASYRLPSEIHRQIRSRLQMQGMHFCCEIKAPRPS